MGEWVGGVVGVGSVCLTQKRVGAAVKKMWHCAVLWNTPARPWLRFWPVPGYLGSKDESAIRAASLTWLDTVMVSGEKGM